ncbi:MAG: MlaE family ABC transporter permease [Brevinema sp.]
MNKEKFRSFLIELGEFGEYTAHVVRSFPSIVRYRHEFLIQIVKIGVGSLPIVASTGFFMGAILGIQLGAAMNHIIRGAASLISGGVVLAEVREMGPILTALIVVSRVSSSVTAEIGSMKVTEQVDALRVMSVDPIEYLAVPRVLAGMLVVPIIGLINIFVGILGAALSMNLVHQVPYTEFFSTGLSILLLRFHVEAMLKLLIFGFLLLLIATFYGFRTQGGSVGVGASTVRAVVVSSFCTILVDYIAGTLFLLIW